MPIKNYGLILMFFSLNEPVITAQEKDSQMVCIPEAVSKAFHKKYPTAGQEMWLQDAENFEVRFSFKEKNVTAEFDKNGEWLFSETELNYDDVPVKSIDYIRANYPGYEISSIASEVNPYNKLLILRIRSETSEGDIIFDNKGNFLNFEGLEE